MSSAAVWDYSATCRLNSRHLYRWQLVIPDFSASQMFQSRFRVGRSDSITSGSERLLQLFFTFFQSISLSSAEITTDIIIDLIWSLQLQTELPLVFEQLFVFRQYLTFQKLCRKTSSLSNRRKSNLSSLQRRGSVRLSDEMWSDNMAAAGKGSNWTDDDWTEKLFQLFVHQHLSLNINL